MPLASPRSRKSRARKCADALAQTYPDAGCALGFRNPLEVLVATILSAQCTDKKVNEVTPALFERYPDADAYAEADRQELEAIIRPIGLYKGKSKNIIAAAAMIRNDFNARVPDSIEDLVKLPGVGRKTANCVVLNGYGKPGLMCDTHFCRVTRRIGLHELENPDKIEFALAELLPPEDWGAFSHRIIIHGRQICTARKTHCESCCLRRWCDTGRQRPAR